MGFWFDVTTTVSCPPPARGIPRVESNLAQQLCELERDVHLCFYEAQAGRFSELPLDEFMRIRHLCNRLARPPNPSGCRSFGMTGAPGGMEIFDRGDVLITCGLNWQPNFGNMGRLYELQKLIGLRLVTTCYDLIPIMFTNFVPGMEKTFSPYLLEMVRRADHVLCISRCTRRDLLHWINTLGERIPDTSVIPLGCELQAAGDDNIGEDIRLILGQRYLLSVSTIERRKNHETLCRAYTRLVDWGVRDLPRLVLVGGIGVGGQGLIDEIAADRRISERVVILSRVTDAGLAALYERCLFTLYPSLYEELGGCRYRKASRAANSASRPTRGRCGKRGRSSWTTSIHGTSRHGPTGSFAI